MCIDGPCENYFPEKCPDDARQLIDTEHMLSDFVQGGHMDENGQIIPNNIAKIVISVPFLNMTSAAPLSVVLSLLSQRKEGKEGAAWVMFKRGTEITVGDFKVFINMITSWLVIV